EYEKEIRAAIPAGNSFKPLMTFYLTKNLSPEEIEKGWSGEHGVKVFAVKSYPYGATTNSQWGFRSILEANDELKKMEEVGMPLLLHGEVHLNDRGEEEDPYEGERLFVQNVLPKLLDQFPKLKVSLEHLSTAVACDFLENNGKPGQVVATITPTHLMYDRRDAFRGGYRPLLHMKPLIKTESDKERVRDMAKKGLPFISAGTDSAPHPENKKFSACCSFGVFCSPAAVEMYTQVFDELGALDKLENFLSINGPKFFGIEPSKETVTLVKQDWQLKDPVVTDDGSKIWPLGNTQTGFGDETIRWRVA
ncbi:MAG TPA: dihydroorotase, partial [Candidatus Paceibacterota bacterium]|nr:dihydroorotase [Candidatus Paceibacterota bacterium]